MLEGSPQGDVKVAKKWKLLLLSIGAITMVVGCLFILWMLTSTTTVGDYILMHRRDDRGDLAIAFTIALRKNHPSAYEMIDPALIPRLDRWMSTHQAPQCARTSGDILSGGGSKGIGVYYSCTTRANRGYGIVLDVVIEDMTVTDWEVIDENY